MKKLFIISLLLFLSSCSEREIEYEELNERQGIYYAPFEDEPYSGKATTTWDGRTFAVNGHILYGKKYDLWRDWHENGQLKGEITFEANYVNGKVIK